MANVKKAFIGENRDLVDPYVQVQFAGQKVIWFYSYYCSLIGYFQTLLLLLLHLISKGFSRLLYSYSVQKKVLT